MSVKLFTLGLVFLRDTHGYEIKEIAKLWGIERWAKIGFGSIYHALGKLQEEELIVELRLEQEGNRPERTVYRITETGEEAFFALLRHTCRTADPETRDLDMALAFIDQLPAGERVALLTERLEALEPRYQFLVKSMENYQQARGIPGESEAHRILREVPWVEAGVAHSLGRIAFEREWLKGVIATVASWPARPRERSKGL
jgi:DNA-binding PadR family transcriptional regulator